MDRLMAPDISVMLEFVLRATVLLSAGLALAWVARKGPAGGRHLLWTMTFAFLLGLPVMSLLGPSWELPLLPSPGGMARQPLPESARVDVVSNGLIALAVPEPDPPPPGARSTATVTVGKPLPPTRPISLPLLLWALGCAAGLVSLAMGGLRFAGLVRAADPLRDTKVLRRAGEVRRRLGIRGDVRLFVSPAAATPMTGGLRKPVILLPGSARSWSPERWDVVLTHEMIHVRRRDVLRQFMVRAALALFWFHPLIWVAARLARTASEEACDEEVLALGTRPSRYATHLLSLATGMIARRPVLSLSMGQRPHSQLESRIMAILKPHRPRRNAAATALIVLAISGAGVSAAFAHPVQSSSSDTVVAVVAARIGSTGLDDDSDEYIFGRVMSVAADRHGKIYVADLNSPSVRVFGPDGGFMAWIGREGEGPGEFAWPVDILPADDGRLFVRGSRITTFAAGDSSEYPDQVVDTWRIPPHANFSSWRARLVEGFYYYPHYRSRRDEPVEYFYLKYGPEGHTGDTAHVPDAGNLSRQFTAFYMVSQGSGRMVDGLNIAPFAPRADWDMTGNGTIVGVHVGASDRIWVERWPPEGMGSSRYYDVLRKAWAHPATTMCWNTTGATRVRSSRRFRC